MLSISRDRIETTKMDIRHGGGEAIRDFWENFPLNRAGNPLHPGIPLGERSNFDFNLNSIQFPGNFLGHQFLDGWTPFSIDFLALEFLLRNYWSISSNDSCNVTRSKYGWSRASWRNGDWSNRPWWTGGGRSSATTTERCLTSSPPFSVRPINSLPTICENIHVPKAW